MNKYLYEIVIATIIIIALTIGLVILPKGHEPDLEGKKIWYKQVESFYQDAAEVIIDKAKGADAIELHAEENVSNYLCSSPCNEGLYNVLKKMRKVNPAVPEAYYFKQPIYTSRVSRWLSTFVGRLPFVPEKWRKRLIGEWLPNDLVLSNPLEVRIIIEKINLDKENYEASFSLVVDEKKVFNKEYKGDALQIRWFLRGKNNWLFWIIAGFCIIWFILIILLLANLLSLHDGNMPEEALLATGFIFIGLISCFILLFCTPLQREVAQYSKVTNVFFLIDQNSEIFFGQPHAKNEKVAPPYFIQHTCENAHQGLTEQKPWESMPFLKWLFTKHALASIYASERFSLNRMWRFPVYAFSGFQGEDRLRKFDGDTFVDTIVDATRNNRVVREARLFIPQNELKDLIDDPKSDNFACFFTSASGSCEEDVLDYQKGISKLRQRKESTILKVFTVFMPTIPRTGANHRYDYEDRKIELVSYVSDKLNLLNSENYNERLKIDYERILPQFIGLYDIKGLGFQNRLAWDRPCDLLDLRFDNLLVDKEKAEIASKAVADEFVEFVKEIRREKQEYNLVHVLKNESSGLWLVLISCSLGGFWLFTQIKDLHYGFKFKDDSLIKSFDFVELIASFIVFMICFFAMQRQYTNTLIWTSLGHPDVAFIAGLLFWICFFCGPFFVFRLWNRGSQLDNTKIWVCIVCILGVGLFCGFYLLYQGDFINKELYLYTFLITILLVFLPFVFLPLLVLFNRGNEPPQYIPGIFPWWKRPWWTLIIKIIILFCLVIVIRGAFHANPSGIISYPRLALALPISLSIVGLALLAPQRPLSAPTIAAVVTFIILMLILIKI